MQAEKNKASSADKEKARILTPEFRVSFPHLFKPSGMKGTSPDSHKYSVTMLFEKDSDLSIIKGAIKQAKINYFGPNKSEWPDDILSPVGDGDSPKNADKEGYKNHWVIKASSNQDQKPGVVDEHVKEILDQAKLYPGCYARAYVYAYVWEFPKGSKRYGIGFILDHVQKLRDGKSFAGKKPADQVFSPVAGADDGGEEATATDDGF